MDENWNAWPQDEDSKRRAEIEQMMRSQREFYFRNEPVQQEYRDIVDRQIAAQQPAGEAVAKPATSPEAYHEALARFRETGTFFADDLEDAADVDDALAPLGKGDAAETPGLHGSGTIPAEHNHQQFASTAIPSGITLQEDSAGDKPERFSRQAMSHDLAKAYSVDLPQLNNRQVGLDHKPQWVRVAQNDAQGNQPGGAKLPLSVKNFEIPLRFDGVDRVREPQVGNDKKDRSLPIELRLKDQLNYAAEKNGVMVEVFSGGQFAAGEGRRVKDSGIRHDHGGAADVDLYEIIDGKKRYLDARNENDRRRMQDFIRDAVIAGATGVGHALNYMGPTRIHIGGGEPRVWGADYKSRTAVPWVVEAHRQGMSERARLLKSGGWPHAVGPNLSVSADADGLENGFTRNWIKADPGRQYGRANWSGGRPPTAPLWKKEFKPLVGVIPGETGEPADMYHVNKTRGAFPDQRVNAALSTPALPKATGEFDAMPWGRHGVPKPPKEADWFGSGSQPEGPQWSNEDERLSLIRRIFDSYMKQRGVMK